MLSRTADHLYWMTRYIERAENIARFLEVANRLSLSGGDPQECWKPVLTISGEHEAYAERHGEVTATSVITWTVLDQRNTSSVFGCIRAARENAHAVRSVIPNELWEYMNATWIEMRRLDGASLREQGLTAFCDWVKERSHLLRGAIYGIMMQDESSHFARLGTFIERADNTGRLLGVRAAGVTADSRESDPADQLHWAAVLRSVSAYKAYRALTRDDITPAGVAEMLIINDHMPRSLHFCLDAVSKTLHTIAPDAECTRLAGAAHAKLHYGKLNLLLQDGLDEFVEQFIVDNYLLGQQINADFMMSS